MRLRLDAYLLRELLPPFLVSLLAFLVFISLELVLSLSDALFARGVPALSLLRLLSFKLPNILTLAAPAGALLATFLALARLASDRELLALQALGYSLRRILLPFLGFGLAVSVLSLVFSELVVPEAEALYRRELLVLLYRGPTPTIQENVFFRGARGELFYVERYTGSRVEGVVIYDLSAQLFPRSPFPAVITAKEGVLERGELLLREGRVLRFGPAGELTEVLGFGELRFEVGEKLEEAVLGGRTPSEMSARELRERIDLLRQSGHDVRALWVEYHGKLAIAGAAFVFVLFGAPLGVLLGRRGRATGMVVGFLLAAGAQALFLWARTLARRGLLPPFLGGWLPHLVLGSLGILLYLGADRLRFRGALLFLLALGLTGFAAPPLAELSAEELVVAEEGRYWCGRQARLVLAGYTLDARAVEFWEREGWELQAEGARVETEEGWVEAHTLRARLSPEGELVSAELQDFRGEVRFAGPEKPETLRFAAAQGAVEFRQGEITRILGSSVLLTTCPCLEGPPYLIWAEEFLLLPQRWLFVRNVRVDSFGYPLVWLPFYAARLGEESIPFLPEVGRTGLGWFLRWSFPWTPWEGAVGALVLTWYPEAGQIRPGLSAAWEGGSLSFGLDQGFLRISGRVLGEPWQGQARWLGSSLTLNLSGRVRGWSLGIQAGAAEGPQGPYARLPELVLSRALTAWGGDLQIRLGVGHFQEGERVGWRAGLSLGWSRTWDLAPVQLRLAWEGGLDQYPGAERLYIALNPSAVWGGLSLWTQQRLALGRSPFAFDALPSQSQAGLTLSARRAPWTHKLSLGWDFLSHAPLPASWTLSGANFSLSVSLQLVPPKVLQGQARWRGQGSGWTLEVSGGYAGTWQDLLLRGAFSLSGLELSWGARFSPWPLAPRRVYLSAEGVLEGEWSWSMGVEYDFPSQRWVQAEVGLFHTFAGCLRVGLRLGLGTLRLSLDIPAFPEFSLQFAPLDEGLRLGGL